MASELRTVPFRDSAALLGDPVALRARAAEDGYVLLRGLVARERVAALADAALRACAARRWLAGAGTATDARAQPGVALGAHDDPRYHGFLAEIVPSPAFAALRDDSALQRAVAAVHGGPVRPSGADVVRVFSPDARDATTGPHQDGHYLPAATSGWTAWLPLTDCPVPLGPLAVLPGSHRDGLRPHAGAGVVRTVAVPDDAVWANGDLWPGDCVVFHCCTVHRALPNRSDRLRLSVDYRFVPAA